MGQFEISPARRAGTTLGQRGGVVDGDFAAVGWDGGEAVAVGAEDDLAGGAGTECEQELACQSVPNLAAPGEAFAIRAEGLTPTAAGNWGRKEKFAGFGIPNAVCSWRRSPARGGKAKDDCANDAFAIRAKGRDVEVASRIRNILKRNKLVSG
jgi:hypothetical protein